MQGMNKTDDATDKWVCEMAADRVRRCYEPTAPSSISFAT
jgi:hypothetical protein